MKNKLELNFFAKDLAGNDTKLHVGKMFANSLAARKTAEPAKYMGWANQLYTEPHTIEVTDSEAKEIKEFITKEKPLSAFIADPIIELINKF